MTTLHHLNCLKIVSPVNDNVIGHCLLLENNAELYLVDTGIGLLDTQKPDERIGQPLIDIVGFQFNEARTAIKQIEQLGLDPDKVTHCVITHLDPDHIGGLADFPNAVVHVGVEEYQNFKSGNPRYLPQQLDHNPTIVTYAGSTATWFGFEARKVNLNSDTELYLIPLFGHTLGHCGVALQHESGWLFYIGDAYYMKVELTDAEHPVNELARMRADNDGLRIETLNRIRAFVEEHPEITVFGYHDIAEFQPAGIVL